MADEEGQTPQEAKAEVADWLSNRPEPAKPVKKRRSPPVLDGDDEPEMVPEKEPGLGSLVSEHEFNAQDQTTAHRLVATSMIIIFLVVAIKQNWWMHLRDWINTKTHGPAQKSPPGGGGGATNITP